MPAVASYLTEVRSRAARHGQKCILQTDIIHAWICINVEKMPTSCEASEHLLWASVVLPPAVTLCRNNNRHRHNRYLQICSASRWINTVSNPHTYSNEGNSRCSWAHSIRLTTCPVRLHRLSSRRCTSCNTTASLQGAQESSDIK